MSKETKDIWGVNNWIDPWMKAVENWNTEAQKLHQTTVEGMTKALDNTHVLAKQGLGMAAEVSSTINKQVKAQIDRTVSLMSSFTQR